MRRLRRLVLFATAQALTATTALAAPTSVLFAGHSYTFGRVNLVMSYHAAKVRDLSAALYGANSSGSHAFEPHAWGGVAGIFKPFTVQAGQHVRCAARRATA